MEETIMNESGRDEAPHFAVADNALRTKGQERGAGRVKESQLARVDGRQQKREETSPKEDRVETIPDFVDPAMYPSHVE
jgi:hypothetical protein